MMKRIKVEINNRQDVLPCRVPELQKTVEKVIATEGIGAARISLAIVDDPQMVELNRRFMGRDDTTDVLAFNYEENGAGLEGEIIVNAAVACRCAEECGHPQEVELLLYAAHGALHLTGWDDDTPARRRAMNNRAADVLADLGWEVDRDSL
jgi:probable rRNA maturation factor